MQIYRFFVAPPPADRISGIRICREKQRFHAGLHGGFLGRPKSGPKLAHGEIGAVRAATNLVASSRPNFFNNEVELMISTGAKEIGIEHLGQVFRYDSNALLALEEELARELPNDKQDRSKRSNNPKRYKSPKASSPGCGIAGRCNHRWTW